MRRPGRPAVPAVEVPVLVGCDGGLGVVVVNGFSCFREPGSPNGPPSPRLAPGGFYGNGDWLRAKRGACTLFQPYDARHTRLAG